MGEIGNVNRNVVGKICYKWLRTGQKRFGSTVLEYI